MRVQTFLLSVCVLLAGCSWKGNAKESATTPAQGEPTKEDVAGVWTNWEPASKTVGLHWEGHEGSSVDGIPLSPEVRKEANGKRRKASSTKTKEKVPVEPTKNNDPMHLDIKDIREKVFGLGKLILDFVTGAGFGQSGLGLRNFFPADTNAESRAFRQGSFSVEGNRGVIDWLARLIGVSGKSLGEFLREYQVHVLYDLVFTFFKWIFFLYAGLLIP